MKYVIMADGKGSRWNAPLGIPKHLIEVDGEILLHRIVRLLKKFDNSSQIIITSHDKRYDIEGATRYEPKHNILEIDRFTEELIEDNVCFLYGDTYYEEEDLKIIVEHKFDDSIMFYGNHKSIVAIRVNNADIFNTHIISVRELFLTKKIKKCIGWQVYASFTNGNFESKEIKNNFIVLKNETTDFNRYEEYISKTSN